MYGQPPQQQCLNCGGPFEYAGGGQYARCMRCLALFQNQGGQLTPIVVQAPGGGHNPEFNAMFAQNLGFGPPPPGAGMQPPPQHGQGPQGPQHNMAQGTFDMGGGQQLQVTIDGKTPENYLKNKASGMIMGWIIGAVILGLVVLTFAGIGIYVYVVAKDSASGTGGGVKTASAAAWDGKSTFECKANDAVTLTGVKANVSGTAIKASGNCQLTLTGVDITAGVGIEASANAKVQMTGGSITATTNSVVASAAAKVDLVGTKVSGKAKQSGAAKITGAPL
ncbi:MAG: hypothetical protein JST00_37390 [Deltaproteobacteria bacterium]|nr:hypothetical protein [Deltaproteobacteria bacterium]